uniref:FG-GAP repeat domain-containing protein n=1 Tax=Flavobacterium sp. TaxID=239 RepID=UPI004049ECCF
KRKPSKLFLQQSDGEFSISQEELFLTDALSEDTSSVFFDANNDDYPDLLVVSGGNEFRNGKPLQPRLYINQKGKFIRDFEEFNDVELNASKVIAFDFENDGDLDIVITSDQVPWQFGKTPQQYLFINNGNGKFINQTHNISPEFLTIGNIKDIKPIDLNKDGLTDFIAVGNWMEVSIFLNDGKKFKLQKNNGLEQSNGLWNTIEVGDFDKDGDYDIIAGNWGINSKFKASFEKPIKLYKYDFDANGSIDPIITFFYENIETTIASKDEIVKQLPYLNKKFLSYETFANATIEDLLSPEKIKKSSTKSVYQLETSYFVNDGNNNFKLKTLPIITQSSSVHDIQILDFNNDGYEDILLVGNTYEISTQLGRLDANHGILLLNDKQGNFNWENTQDLNIKGAARSIEKISIANKNYLIVGINNEAPILLQTN